MSGLRVMPKSIGTSMLNFRFWILDFGFWIGSAINPKSKIQNLKWSSVGDNGIILVGPPVAVKLPDVADLAVLLQIQLGHQHLLVFVACFGDNLAARVDEVGCAVEVVVAQRLL